MASFWYILCAILSLTTKSTALNIPSPHPVTSKPRGLNRELCQKPTPDPLQGCPRSTILVGQGQRFTTIQSAVESIPNNTSPAYILILPGNYTEQVNVTRSAPLYLLGQTAHPRSQADNTVNVIWRAIPINGSDNAFTATLTVAPNLDAALTGSGPSGHTVPPGNPFGNVDFRTYNLNFINDWLPYTSGQSLAVSTGYVNTGFYYSGFFSYQDTVYIGKVGSAYFKHCTIAGQTDFLYGFGTAWIESSDLRLRGCGGGITAWKGSNTTFPNKYGVYIHNSHVQKANSSLSIQGKCALGRPWNNQMRSIFANNYLDDSINPAGYIPWAANPDFSHTITNQTLMWEYKDFGPGFNASARAAAFPVTREMTTKQFAEYDKPEKVFQYPDGTFGNVGWIDRSV